MKPELPLQKGGLRVLAALAPCPAASVCTVPPLLHRPDPFPLRNVSRGSPTFYFYSRFGSHWVSRKLCLPGCITNTFHALFSPSPFPPKPFLSPLRSLERGIVFLPWPQGSAAGPAPPGPATALWIAEGPADRCRPFTSACVCWFVSRAPLVRQHPANNCTAWTSEKRCL